MNYLFFTRQASGSGGVLQRRNPHEWVSDDSFDLSLFQPFFAGGCL